MSNPTNYSLSVLTFDTVVKAIMITHKFEIVRDGVAGTFRRYRLKPERKRQMVFFHKDFLEIKCKGAKSHVTLNILYQESN